MISDASDRGYRIIDLRSAGDGWNDAPSRAPSGVRVTPESALQCSTLLACCRLIAENCAQLPLRIMRRLPDGGKAKAKELPLYRILGQAPNPWQTSFEFRELLTFWTTVYGNGFAEIRSGDRGSVDSLWPLHPSRMRVEQLPDGSLCYYYREGSGSETRYRQDQIFHLRWLSNDSISGMVPVTLSRDAIALAQALEVHGGTYFGNSCRLSGIMTSANPINTETAERLREQFERMHRGPDRAHRTAVLPAGVEWKDMSATHTDAQFLEARAYQVLEICRAYRVDPSYVQSKEKVGYASQEQSAIDLVQQTLMPWFRRWESAIARDLIARDDIYYAQFDVASLLRGDLAAQSAWLREMVALGVYSINECRDILGMNPIPEGNQRYLQTNLTTLEGIAASAAKPEESPAPAPLPLPAPAGRDARHCGTGYGGFKGKNTCAAGHKGKNAYSDGKKPKAAPKGKKSKKAASVDEATGLPLNDDGTVTVYHHTSKNNAEQIKKTGALKSAGEPHVYVTTQKDATTGYGDAVVAVNVNPAALELDDEFPDGRKDFKIAVDKPGGSVAVGVAEPHASPDVSPPGKGAEPSAAGVEPVPETLKEGAFADARREHKKALDKLRKTVIKAQEKAQAKFQQKWDAHTAAKDALQGVLERVEKIDADATKIYAAQMSDPSNEKLKSDYADNMARLKAADADVKKAKKQAEEAYAAREKARQDMRNAAAIALAKECASVAKEDGTDGDLRRSAEWVATQNVTGNFADPELASALIASESRDEAQAFLRQAVNADIHAKALTCKLEYREPGFRAHATVGYDADAIKDFYRKEREQLPSGGLLPKPKNLGVTVGEIALAVTDEPTVLVHETGHQLEHGNHEAAELAMDFVARRTANDSDVNMRERFGIDYDAHEVGRPDNFENALSATGYRGASSKYLKQSACYAGKRYNYGTELISMGLELVSRDATAFAKADPEWFDLVVGVATGRILTKTRDSRRTTVAKLNAIDLDIPKKGKP